MRIALAQLNPVVGDIAGNTAMILNAVEQARADEARVLVCAELAVLGYPPRDLLLREGVVKACEEAVKEIAEHAGDLTVVVGHPRLCPGGLRSLRNSLSVCRNGEIIAVYDKQLLPGYDVFDEDRYFDCGDRSCVIDVDGTRIGLLICEDFWRARDVEAHAAYQPDPLHDLMQKRCDLVACINASPFVMGKGRRHLEQIINAARRFEVPIVSVNQAGANDDLIFDGRSVLVSAAGEVLAMLPAFEAAVRTVQLSGKPIAPPAFSPMDELYHALVVGVRDYLHKTGTADALIGLSGGIDSAVTAVIAAAALGPEHVVGAMMPSIYSSPGSIEDSLALANNLGLRDCYELPIINSHALIQKELAGVLGDISNTMTDENVQARLRGLLLMAISNSQGSLLLTTSNKSEIAVGYSTLYGDMAGAVVVLGDVLKTRVYELARWINHEHRRLGFAIEPIPEPSITKPPSAELRPNQTDQDTLPPYETLDAVIEQYIEHEYSVQQIVETTGLDAETVEATVKMIDRAQYKREQAAMILKVSPRAFGRGRVMPVVARYTMARSSCPTVTQ